MSDRTISEKTVNPARVDATARMGTDSVWHLLITMGIPGILSTLTTYFYTMVDQIFVGNFVGRNALGSLSLITPFNNIVNALAMFATVGGPSLLAVYLGAGRKKEADRLFTNILVEIFVISLTVTVLFSIWTEGAIRLFGGKVGTEVYAYAVDYLRILVLGEIFNMATFGLSAIIRTEGHATYFMFSNLFGAVANLGFNTLFMVVLHLGIRGAALGTVASQVTGALIGAAFFLRGKSQLHWTGFSTLKITIMLHAMRTGIAPAVFQILSFFTTILTNISLQQYGDLDAELAAVGGGQLAVSANGVVVLCESMIVSISLGINQAAAPLISYNYGAGKPDRVKKITLDAQLFAFAFAIPIWCVMMFAPHWLIALFGKEDAALIAFGSHAMRLSKAFAFLVGYQTLVSMFFSAITRPGLATLVSLFRHGIFLVPALLILPHFFGLDGVLLAGSVSDGCSVIVVSILYIVWLRRLGKPENQGI